MIAETILFLLNIPMINNKNARMNAPTARKAFADHWYIVAGKTIKSIKANKRSIIKENLFLPLLLAARKEK